MAENNDNIILNLMQNVSDKLDEISKNVDKPKAPGVEKEFLLLQEENLKSILNNQEILNRNCTTSKDNLKEVLEENPTVVNQNYKTDYMLFGKDTPFTSKLLLSLIFALLLSYPIFKYIPQYINESSKIKEERDNYELFYNYVFLNSASKSIGTARHLQNTLERIESKDTVVLNQIEVLTFEFKKQLKKESLEEELKKLEE